MILAPWETENLKRHIAGNKDPGISHRKSCLCAETPVERLVTKSHKEEDTVAYAPIQVQCALPLRHR